MTLSIILEFYRNFSVKRETHKSNARIKIKEKLMAHNFYNIDRIHILLFMNRNLIIPLH